MPLLAIVVMTLLAQVTPAAAPEATAADSARRAAEAAEKAAEAAARAADSAARVAEALGKLPAVPAAAPATVVAAAAAPVVWTGTVALAFIALTGNSQTLTFSTNAAFERKSTEWIWGIKAYGAYGQNTLAGQSASQVTALNAGMGARGDRRFTDQLSVYLLAGVDTDHLKSVESRPFGELGVALIWFDQKEGSLEKTTLRTDLGFRYGREYRFQYYPVHVGPGQDPAFAEVDVVAPRLGAFYRYAINKDVIFTEEASAIGNVVGEARLLFTSTTKLSSRLTEKVSLGVGFVVNDDTVPPKGKVPADTALTVALEIGI
jgi:putative salt-induced outer membrane protein YdiY